MIVANTTYRIAPWADALFAMDKQWWDQHRTEVAEVFRGERISSNPIPVNWGVRRMPNTFKAYGNSGAACVALAVSSGAQTVVMLGYDCQHTEGKTHWHGSHPRGLGDAGSINKWPAKFRELAKDVLPKANIINASRVTALDMFHREGLEECLKRH